MFKKSVGERSLGRLEEGAEARNHIGQLAGIEGKSQARGGFHSLPNVILPLHPDHPAQAEASKGGNHGVVERRLIAWGVVEAAINDWGRVDGCASCTNLGIGPGLYDERGKGGAA